MTPKSPLSALARLLLIGITLLAGFPAQATQAQSAGGLVFMQVTSARTEPRAFDGTGVVVGASVTDYQFIINEDNTGDQTQPRFPDCSPYLDPPTNAVRNPSYPQSCTWSSIRAVPGSSPIITQGDASLLNAVSGLTLPVGRYLISVLADGYKLGGLHFSVPASAPLSVQLQPLPLPAATIRVQVFNDNNPTNSAPDVPIEDGLAGFGAVVADIGGQVSTDVFGNPICTQYERDSFGQVIVDASGTPTNPIPGTGGECLSDANGIIEIPNLGPNRYAVSVVPPNGTDWIQTTTLEGNHDWDTWLQEGATGNDTEFNVAGEPFPFTIFGFVRPVNRLTTPTTGEIRGQVLKAKVYVPLQGGLPYQGGIWGGLSGVRTDGPIERPVISLNALALGDQSVWVGRGELDGTFRIVNVPDGDYMLTYWDEAQLYILDLVQVTVSNGQVNDVGQLYLTGWFTTVEGYVFNDLNSNGSRDPGEPGIANYPVAVKRRENSLIDRGSVVVNTDPTGYYVMESLYPLTQWMILEAYNDRFYTTGVTFQTDNQAMPTTVLGNGVDVGVLPIIGQSGRLDWGVRPYAASTNGGIVGTVAYDTTRNEIDPRYAAVEGWSPGIPGMTVNLYRAVRNPDGSFATDPLTGAYLRSPLLNTAETEAWERPQDCQARGVDGSPISEAVLAPGTGGFDCLEGPLMGVQFQSGFASLDGNYGFTEMVNDPVTGAELPSPQPLPPGDYLVEVVSPTDIYGSPIYQVTREEDINVFGGDSYTPQIPPPACVGALHTIDVAGIGADGPDAVANPSFVDAGGSPYEGTSRALCDVKLVTLNDRRSIAPTFNYFTNVPIPGKFFGYIVDDLNLSSDPRDLLYGEKAGVPNSPIGVYDYSNRLVTTIQSDANGIFEVLLPSTSTINCPSPTGVCANLYRLVGNDPGVPGRLNPAYNPQFRTIAATFEIFPGTVEPADLAPTQIGVSIQGPGSQFNGSVICSVPATTPQIFALDRVVFQRNATTTIRITGDGFGAARGSGNVTLDGTPLAVTSWNNRLIVVNLPANSQATGTHQLHVTNGGGFSTRNGITLHVRGTGYNPTLFEVGPGRAYTRIQAALNAATSIPQALVVVYPGGVPDPGNPTYNPEGAYFENIIVQSPVKLQGVGPGGVYPDGTPVAGSIIDGGSFGGDTATANIWRQLITQIQQTNPWSGTQNVAEGQVVYVLARNGQFTDGYRATIDGFKIQGGDQQGFPNNINQVGGTPTGQPAQTETQGGGIFVNAYARSLQITNNILQSNGGSYGGAIRIGTPSIQGVAADNQNDFVRIASNRLIANGGTNLAGAIAIFSGTQGYEIANNELCGNFSAEYGGAISHYGLSPNGTIHHNRIVFNRSYDEGGAILIAGELPVDPGILSPGAGPVDVYNNLIQGNLSNDDGGGLRFLMAGNFAFNVYNNTIVNNVATHQGAGVALDDAPNVRFFNNTVMKNITTATALTSDGSAAPTGLSTGRNSVLLQATLPVGSPIFSNPLLFNNVFWDNRAGSWAGGGVAGIGQPGDPNPIAYWDMGTADGTGALSPTNSVLQVANGTLASPTNQVGVNPLVVSSYDTLVAVFPWRTNPGMIGAAIVAVSPPNGVPGDYHLASTSTAINTGVSGRLGILAPPTDRDDDPRPFQIAYDIGADEIGVTQTPVLDTFNRANGAVGGNWRGQTGTGAYRIQSQQVQARGIDQYMYWNTPFGARQEAFVTFNAISSNASTQSLLLKMTGLSGSGAFSSATTRLIAVTYRASTSRVVIETFLPGRNWFTHATFTGVTLAPGDLFSARALADGTVQAYRNGVLIGQFNVTTGPSAWPAVSAAQGGVVGVWFIGPSFTTNEARFDNFGGGNLR